MQKRQTTKIKKSQMLHWTFRFQEELEDKIHAQSSLERCFRLSLSGRVTPDHFPFVFWKAPFLFDKTSWVLAEEIMTALYQGYITNIERLLNEERERILHALLNYALWKGRFSWIYSLVSSFYEHRYFHSELFEFATLSLAYMRKYNIARFYYEKIEKASPYFCLCYQILTETFREKREKNEKMAIAENPSLNYALVKASLEMNGYEKKQIISELCEVSEKEEKLLDQYAALLALGLLFRSIRLILRYLKEVSEKDYLLDIVLQSYLQNQKHYPYLLRILTSPISLKERHWYEVEYCISCLNLEAGKVKIWEHITKNKKSKPLYPQALDQHHFHDLMQKAKLNQAQLPQNLAPSYSSIILNRYLSALIPQPNNLRRRYSIYHQLIVSPLARGQEIDPSLILLHGPSIFWTLYLYLGYLSQTPFMSLLESLTGQNLSLRALYAIHHFERESRKRSAKLLLPTSHNHPMLKTIQIELLMEQGQLQRAKKIASYLERTYPKDSIIQSNYAFVLRYKNKKSQAKVKP